MDLIEQLGRKINNERWTYAINSVNELFSFSITWDVHDGVPAPPSVHNSALQEKDPNQLQK